MINKYIRMDAWRDNAQVPAPILLIQGESLGRKIYMQLLSYDNPINLTGLSVNFYFKKPSGKEEFLPMQIEDATSGKCSVEITSQACAEAGFINSAEIRISLNGGGNLRVLGPALNIMPGMSDKGILSSNEYAALDEALASINSKAPLASPTFTGTPSAPTAAEGTNTAQIATTEYVQTEMIPMNTHMENAGIHVTTDKKSAWDGHLADLDIHVTADKKTAWDGHLANADIHVTAALNQKLAGFEPLKLLWSGTWESGSISVPGFQNYQYLVFETNAYAAPMLIANYTTWAKGGGNTISGGGEVITNHISFSASGDTLTLDQCVMIIHTASSSHSAKSNDKVRRIYGLA